MLILLRGIALSTLRILYMMKTFNSQSVHRLTGVKLGEGRLLSNRILKFK